MQEFLVTEEIKQFAGGEVTLTVHIDEEEYRNAKLDLLISETDGNCTIKSPCIMASVPHKMFFFESKSFRRCD